MNQEELKELVHFLSEKDIYEFSIERADSAVRIKRNVESQSQITAPSVPVASNAQVETAVIAGRNDSSSQTVAVAEKEELHILKSPMVGIFRRGPAAGGRPFVAEGDPVRAGQIVGMIEVLRLMHEVQSDVSGQIVEVTAGDREPVEYGQALFAVRSNKHN